MAHIYLLHPPGGIVSGDELSVGVELEESAQALITTPGAARIYRARQEFPLQQQRVNLTVGPKASLEWFPLETIVYNGACVELETSVNLAEGSSFTAWEVSCMGLPASDQPFENGSFRQQYRIFENGLPIFVDRLNINNDNINSMLASSAGMQGMPVSGFFLMGPFEQIEDSVIEQLRAGSSESCAAISLVDRFIVARYLGWSAEQARACFSQYWKLLRPLLISRNACAPRIWFT